MKYTPFAGLTDLDPSDPISTDNSSFQSRNPAVIDRYLQVGAVTHHHDAHAALTNPTLPPSAGVTASGGQIPGDTPIYLGYTLTDASGGETLLSPTILITTQQPYQLPTTVPSATADYTGGMLLANTYWYGLTLTDGVGGETPMGPIATVVVAPGYASARVQFSNLDADFAANAAAGWRLYRALPGQAFGFLASGTGAAYTDDGSISAMCSIQPPPPGQNTTAQQNALTAVVPSGQPSAASPYASGVSFNIYVTNTGSFGSPALLGTYPLASCGVPITFTSLLVQTGAPPPVSTCIPGAAQINPDTDILNWTWKRPVATLAQLPATGNASGDARMALDTGHIWRFIAGTWMDEPGGVGGGLRLWDSATIYHVNDWVVAGHAHDPGWSLYQAFASGSGVNPPLDTGAQWTEYVRGRTLNLWEWVTPSGSSETGHIHYQHAFSAYNVTIGGAAAEFVADASGNVGAAVRWDESAQVMLQGTVTGSGGSGVIFQVVDPNGAPVTPEGVERFVVPAGSGIGVVEVDPLANVRLVSGDPSKVSLDSVRWWADGG